MNSAVQRLSIMLVTPPDSSKLDTFYRELSEQEIEAVEDKLEYLKALTDEATMETTAFNLLSTNIVLGQCYLGVAKHRKILTDPLFQKVLRDAVAFQDCLIVSRTAQVIWTNVVTECTNTTAGEIKKKLAAKRFTCTAATNLQQICLDILALK